MGSKVVKYNTYRLIDNNSFELPLPFRFDIYRKEYLVAEYEITEDERVECNIITKHKENMITPVHRPLTLSDVHYLFSCRVFQDMTPYTAHMLKCVGLEKYNVLDIITRTHGIVPYDNYWLRFGDEDLNYELATESFNAMMAEPVVPAAPQPAVAQSGPDVSEILSQHTIDISGIVARDGAGTTQTEAENMVRTAVAFTPAEKDDEVVNNKMSEDEIEALLMKAGISSPAMDNIFDSAAPTVEEPSGGAMSQADIEAMFASTMAAPEPVSAPAADSTDGSKMSQDDIAALFAANAVAEPEPAPVVEEAPASGGKMSQDDIAALFAANAAAEPEPAPVVEEAPASGGKMSQDAIEALLNSMQEEANK